ncbi:MAG: ferritin family protein [Elusimicrobiota bacterium]
MIKLFVCQICGEPYLGASIDDCPFCGAPKKYLNTIDDYSKLWDVELTGQEKSDMKETLDLEINASAYYKKVSKANEKYSKMNRLFKQFARVEEEHAEVAAKFLGVEEPELKGEDPKGTPEKDLKRTKELEDAAVEKYRNSLKNASNSKVKKFYDALIHAEQGHAQIASEDLK